MFLEEFDDQRRDLRRIEMTERVNEWHRWLRAFIPFQV
jgi:hypothetical protein